MSAPVVETEMAVIGPPDLDTLDLTGPIIPLKARSCGMTDAGRVRASNQDQFLIATLRKALHTEATSLPVAHVQDSGDECQILMVADGMGGHAAGEQASALAIDSVEAFALHTFKWFAQFTANDEDRVLHDFQNALGQANSRILAEAAEHPELKGMGTTLTLAYRLNDRLFVAHVGDSRCYLLRQRALYRLTTDHTLTEDMVRQGVLNPEDAAKHRWRHVITNAVGANTPEVTVEVHKLHLEPGDTLLLCSDGLTNMVSDQEITNLLTAVAEPAQSCKQLVSKANEKGGTDNITVIVAQFEKAG